MDPPSSSPKAPLIVFGCIFKSIDKFIHLQLLNNPNRHHYLLLHNNRYHPTASKMCTRIFWKYSECPHYTESFEPCAPVRGGRSCPYPPPKEINYTTDGYCDTCLC